MYAKMKKFKPVDLFIIYLSCQCRVTLQNELISNRIVVGRQNEKLSQTLHMDSGLNLQAAVNKVRQKESA